MSSLHHRADVRRLCKGSPLDTLIWLVSGHRQPSQKAFSNIMLDNCGQASQLIENQLIFFEISWLKISFI